MAEKNSILFIGGPWHLRREPSEKKPGDVILCPIAFPNGTVWHGTYYVTRLTQENSRIATICCSLAQNEWKKKRKENTEWIDREGVTHHHDHDEKEKE